MIFINSIKFKEGFHPFVKNENIFFKKGVNLIVGDQGAGKSTLLRLVLEENENLLITKIDKPENLYFFDTEKNNPRLDNDSQITDFVRYIVDTEDSKEFSRRVESYGLNYLELTKNKLNEKSHGEIILPMLKDLENLKNSLILLDEPESSLSIRSVYKFIKILRKLEENGNQVLIATHSPIIIEEFGKVYSLDTREWIESDTFVDRMKSY